MNWTYLFEAKGIQRYVLDSGKLRDLIGASDLVSGIAKSGVTDAGDECSEDLIGKVVTSLGLAKRVSYSRRAGGAFCVHADDSQTLNSVKAAIRLAVGLHCPGLEFSDCGPIAGENDMAAMRAAYDVGSALRQNGAAELPPPGNPFTRFAPRTGRVVTRLFHYGNDVFLGDRVSSAQRIHAESLAHGTDNVARRFLGTAKPRVGEEYIFPRNFDDDENSDGTATFPFLGPDRRIALIHADLSGLGEAFQRISDQAKTARDVLSAARAIENAINQAAQRTMQEVIIPAAEQNTLPARPVLLGGDDITIIVRADLAFAFTKVFLENIESETGRAFAGLNRRGLPSHLSACAGIAIVAKGTPLLAANALAENLCKFAKKRVKKDANAPYASAVAFHVAQSVGRDDFEQDILLKEFVAGGSLLTGNPFWIGAKKPETRTFSLDSLKSLAEALAVAKRGRGDLYTAAQTRFSDTGLSNVHFQRWRQKLQKTDGAGANLIEAALKKLETEVSARSQDWKLGVLCDALEWCDLTRAFDEPILSGGTVQ